MPVDERTYAAEVAGWVTEILNRRSDLPFSHALVEDHVDGSLRRHDFRLFERHTNQTVLTGEIKMPDAVQGNHPLNADLVEDAISKAIRASVRYCFTWNVRQFVLFDWHMEGVPLAQRLIEGPTDVVEVSVSDDVHQGWAQDSVKAYWERFLEQFADLISGRRTFDPAPLDQRFISWLEGALQDPIAHTQDALHVLSNNKSEIKDRLDSWMVSQGWELSSQQEQHRQNLDRASRLSCYILLTRLVFYQVLRRRFRQMSPLTAEGVETPEHLREVLDARFGEAVRYSHDYETVFVPDENDFGYTIPFLSPTAPADWARLFQRIEEFDFSSLDFDVIGQMYERLISPGERRRYGQFYTSPDVVDLINAFCIRNPDDHVLDPACGGGTFLVRAYSRKQSLSRSSGGQQLCHDQLLGNIFGVDVGAFPAQLSTINLAVRHLSDEANYPRIAKASFFDAQSGVPLYAIPLTGDSVQEIALPELDAVVGNPPYIRQEGIGTAEKSRYSALFRREWPGQKILSGRSDIYAYFFSHAAHFLKPGGYLGFVTSIGWLDTEYGFRLQELFLRNFKIIAVIESQVEKWFEDARVTTAVTILQREPDREMRDNNKVRFIQLRKPLAEIYTLALDRTPDEQDEATRQTDMDAIRDLIEEIDENQTTEYWRVQVRTQRKLREDGTPSRTEGDESVSDSAEYEGGKWGQYIRAPESWFEMLDRTRSQMTPLRELAEIRRGFTSGADRFYCVRDVTQQHLEMVADPQEFKDRWGISRRDTRRVRIIRDGENVEHLVEKRFIEPELHSLMEVKRAVVGKVDVRRMVINASVPRARIRRTHFGDYVAYAERNGWHTGSTVASRGRSRPWYDLGLRPKSTRADMFWPMAQQYRHVVPTNKEFLPANHNLLELWSLDRDNTELLWSVLNSTVTALSKHQFGRAAGVEGNLKTEVIDVRMMLVPDIRGASTGAAARAVTACRRLSRRDARRFLHEEFELEDRRILDDATLEILGIDSVEERNALLDKLYREVSVLQQAIRAREIIAQRDRRRSNRRAIATPQYIADELWNEHEPTLDLLEFPEDFVTRSDSGELFDLPSGSVEVGASMLDVGNLLRVGTIRVGGQDGEVIDVESVSQGRFLEALSTCHRSGRVRLPNDEVCADAVNNFDQYREELRGRLAKLARQRTNDQRRQQAITDALLRKALQWRRT